MAQLSRTSSTGALSTLQSRLCADHRIRNVYTYGGNQALMIKSNHGSGYVKNVQFQNFISRGTAYGLNIDQYWSSQSAGSGAGVELSNITFTVCCFCPGKNYIADLSSI